MSESTVILYKYVWIGQPWHLLHLPKAAFLTKKNNICLEESGIQFIGCQTIFGDFYSEIKDASSFLCSLANFYTIVMFFSHIFFDKLCTVLRDYIDKERRGKLLKQIGLWIFLCKFDKWPPWKTDEWYYMQITKTTKSVEHKAPQTFFFTISEPQNPKILELYEVP